MMVMIPSLLLAFLVSLSAAQGAVEQVFITGTGIEGEMSISWVTSTNAESSENVAYGIASSPLSLTATATSNVLSNLMDIPIRIHVAHMTNLQNNTKYEYQLGDDSATTFSFTNAPARAGGKVYAIYGDLGLKDDYSLSSLLAEAEADAFDAVLACGDFAYNLEDEGGVVGNDFMNGMSPIISKVPMFVVAGNHETLADDSFGHYIARFAAANSLGENSGNSGADANRWYSYDDGLVHWVQIDTEIYSYGTQKQIDAQKAWLSDDLAKVDRSKTPWVLSMGHKGYWESPKTNWDSSFR